MVYYKSKNWKKHCNKTPDLQQQKQIQIIEDVYEKLSIMQMVQLARFCEYDIPFPWLDRLKKIEKYNKMYKSASTLEGCILKFGEKEGKKRYEQACNKKAHTIDNYVKLYGEIKGREKFAEKCENNKGNKTIERFVKKYGDADGRKRFRLMREKEKKKHTLESYIQKYGEDEGVILYNEKIMKLHFGSSKEGFIKKYGVIDGPKKMKQAKDHKSLQSFKRKYGEKEGAEKYEKHIELCRFRNTKDFYISKYGIELGERKYLHWCTHSAIGVSGFSKISQQLFELIDSNTENTYYAIKNKEFHKQHKKRSFFYDYVNVDRKKVIEFNGDVFHGNPDIYRNTDKPNPYNDLTCEQIWIEDAEKQAIIKNLGFDVLVIWEKDYNEKPDETIEKCKQHLYG
jgi:very-short-patch-repair endonuclease